MSFQTNFLNSCSALTIALGAVAFSATAHADETQVKYTLAPGATSNPIPVPATNTPISMTCTQNNLGYRGVGQATVLRVAPASFLEWVGMDIASSAAGISSGFSGASGTHIVYCDYSKTVDIQVHSATQIQIVNTNTITMSGVVTFIW
jgi:hypothetical protein